MEGFPGWPGLPEGTGALGRHLYVWVFLDLILLEPTMPREVFIGNTPKNGYQTIAYVGWETVESNDFDAYITQELEELDVEIYKRDPQAATAYAGSATVGEVDILVGAKSEIIEAHIPSGGFTPSCAYKAATRGSRDQARRAKVLARAPVPCRRVPTSAG